MPDLIGMVDNVFLRLGSPRSNRPGYFEGLNAVCTNIRTLKRFQQNTSNVWNYSDAVVQVVGNLSVYQITEPDFGKALSVITWAPNLPTWIARPIPIFEPQNIDYAWGLPQNAAAFFIPYDGSQCTAQRCAFFWTDGTPYIEFLPVPQQSCQYKVRYLQSANGVNTDALSSSPLSNEDADLCEVRSALSLLAITEWMSPDNKDNRAYNAERRRDLAVSLSAEERELTRQFEAAQLIGNSKRLYNRWNPCVG